MHTRKREAHSAMLRFLVNLARHYELPFFSLHLIAGTQPNKNPSDISGLRPAAREQNSYRNINLLFCKNNAEMDFSGS